MDCQGQQKNNMYKVLLKNCPRRNCIYVGFLVSSRVSFVLLSKSERDLDGLEGGDCGDCVVVASVLNDDVGLGGGNDVALQHANI